MLTVGSCRSGLIWSFRSSGNHRTGPTGDSWLGTVIAMPSNLTIVSQKVACR